ncbi:MAG: hypothetical protein KAQ69_03160 [Spirochaetales bacterium]|nr:hypothetical protein [Spirochaetales bacterium]
MKSTKDVQRFKIGAYVPVDIHNQAKSLASGQGMLYQDWIHEAIKEKLEREKEKQS